MTSVRALQSPARRSLVRSVLAALAVACLLVVALCAPVRAGPVELPRPVPRPRLLDVPVMSPPPVKLSYPKR
ncbi:MAG TPA: hypothetical protein VIK01_17115 [Polyangiaceae bacterium]